MTSLNNPIKKFFTPSPELERQLAEASNALQAEFRALHARRNALDKEAHAIETAPPARADLAEFLTDFVDGVLNAEPHGKRPKLLTRLEGFRRAPPNVEAVQASWQTGFRSGLDDYNDVFMALLEANLKEGAARLAESLPWPDPGLPAAERAAKVATLRAECAALLEQATALESRAKRLNVTLTTE